MLRASRVELLLTAADLQQPLQEFSAGRVDDLQVELEDGAAIVRLKVPIEKPPMTVPVELRLTVRPARGTAVEAGVHWSNLPLLPGFLKEMVLQRAFDVLPGQYANGIFRMDLSEVIDEAPVSFALEEVRIAPDGVAVTLRDVELFPVNLAGLVAVESSAIVPVASTEEAEIPEHQSFYQKLREKVTRFSEERAPNWAKPLVPWLLAIPDFFVLMVRLARDPRVPASLKVMAGAVIAYFVTPVDVIPDPIPIIGEIDDLALAIFALEQIAERLDPAIIEEHWPGEGKVLELVAEGVRLFGKVLPSKLLSAIQQVIDRPNKRA